MTLLNFRKEVEEVILRWLRERGFAVDKVPIERPPREDLGDLSTSLPFTLARKLGRDPFEMAKQISGELGGFDLIREVRAAPPGYVNFYVDFEKLASKTVEAILREGSRFGSVNVGSGRKVQVEYTSVNPNKALHIGHARNVCLGMALANILSFTGFRVEKINYIDDTGAQMADIMFGFLKLGFPVDVEGRFDQYCGDKVYVSVVKKLEENPELMVERAKIALEIENRGSEVSRKTREIAERVLREQLKTCWRLGADFDALVWESDILSSKLWEEAFEALKKSSLVVLEEKGRNKGCWVVKLTKVPRYSKETDKVLVKSDGTKTYVAKDISFAMWKLGLLHPPFKFKLFAVQPSGKELWSTTTLDGFDKDFGAVDISINVIDVRQSRLQDTIKIVLSSIYGEEYGRRYVHYAYEVVSLSKKTVQRYLGMLAGKEFIHMSGRRGLYVNVDPVLDFMRGRAKEESLKRNPNIDSAELENISEKIAVASLKYPLLSADLDRIVVFDVDKALNIVEESGSYILYGYARASKILEKAGEVDLSIFNPNLLSAGEERDLIKFMAEFPLTVKYAAENLNVKSLARYMYELTLKFNKFYESCPVLTEAEDVRRNRLVIVKCYMQVMEVLSNLLAFPLINKM